MSPSEVIAIIAGLAALITAVGAAINGVTQAQFKKSESERAEKEQERNERDEEVEATFTRMRGEIARLDGLNTNHRTEIDRLYAEQANMRRAIAERDEKIFKLETELNTERRTNGQLTQRIAELEKQVQSLNQAGKPKPGTGPLPQ